MPTTQRKTRNSPRTLTNFGPWSPKVFGIVHGGDYNPDQWQHAPEILREDLRLMQLAKCNTFSINIFGWAACEPREGFYTWDWLDKTLDDLHGIGAKVLLATPSASRPAWMSERYPEVCRVDRHGRREPHRERINHCFSSPVFRRKAREMAHLLAQRYGAHPAVAGWHVDNELNGECHCPLCHEAFRVWLQQRYGTLERLNAAWWNAFWGHSYVEWSHIRPLDFEHPGMELDWWRFTTDNCLAQFADEIVPLRALTPQLPITSNFLNAGFTGLDYWKFAALLDVASWDAYPFWDHGDNVREASRIALAHDIARSYKGGKPYLLMESCPEAVNWGDVCKGRRPGLVRAAGLQAVAHGSDSVMYFQWRKGRGGVEQFHGAVVDHAGTERTRVFQEVAALGADLQRLDSVAGCGIAAPVALMWDWEIRTALRVARGHRNRDKNYEADAQDHYHECWRRGVAVDAVSLQHDLDAYRVLIAPNLFMVTPAFAERLRAWVQAGGVLVTTYLAGTVDGQGLCHLGGRPGLLREVLGIWAEEMDPLLDSQTVTIQAAARNGVGLQGSYAARHYADQIRLEGARALATYRGTWYAGAPAVTEHRFGKGLAYYLASRNDGRFLSDFYGSLSARLDLPRALPQIPEGIEASVRADERHRHLFLTSFRDTPCRVALEAGTWQDLLTGQRRRGSITLPPLGCAVLRQEQGDGR